MLTSIQKVPVSRRSRYSVLRIRDMFSLTINETKLEDAGTFACVEDPDTVNIYNHYEVIILGRQLECI